METIVQVTLVCVVSMLLALVLKKITPELAMTLTLLTVVLVFVFLADGIRSLFALLTELSDASGVSDALFVPLYKTVGIALVVKAGGSLCRDAGESALEAAVETAGAVCAFLVALPLIRAVLKMLMELIG